MPTTPLLGLPVPALTDPPNAPAQIQSLASAIDPILVPATARKLTRTATTTLSNGGNPVVSWTTTVYNIGDLAYAAGIITIGTAGLYGWTATTQLPASSTASRVDLYVLVNGAALGTADGAQSEFLAPSLGQTLSAGGDLYLQAGNQVQLSHFYSGSGSLPNVTPSAWTLWRKA